MLSLAQDISQTFLYFAIKVPKVKDNFISSNCSKYEWKISRNKTMARFENFRKFVARARNSQLWVSVTSELWKSQCRWCYFFNIWQSYSHPWKIRVVH